MTGRLGAIARTMLPGVRRIHRQTARYAEAWDEANALTLARTGPLWVVLGDSTAQGIGATSYSDGYVGQLRTMLDERRKAERIDGRPAWPERIDGRPAWPERIDGPWRVLNLSRSGARTADVLAVQLPRLEALAQDHRLDLVTCAIGANDLIPTPTDVLVGQLREVIRRLPPGSVIATMPQGLRPRRAVVVNEMIRAEAPAAGLLVADVWSRTGPPWRGKFASDGFHPGSLGYADWAAAFAEALGLTVDSELPR
jgi:acyl-CoA thioesterase-1